MLASRDEEKPLFRFSLLALKFENVKPFCLLAIVLRILYASPF